MPSERIRLMEGSSGDPRSGMKISGVMELTHILELNSDSYRLKQSRGNGNCFFH